MKHLIWTNDYGEYNEEDLKRVVAENADLPIEEVTETAIFDEFHLEVEQALEDERVNLDKETEGRILVIADLDLWNGHKSGYKILDERNLKAMLGALQYDTSTIWSDGRNIRATDAHHDGTNKYLFREIREDRDIDVLLSKIYNGEEITSAVLNRYTKSLARPVGEIYGWCKSKTKAAA